MVGTTHGWIYNVTSVGAGGTTGDRGGYYIKTTGVNTVTSAGWTVKNCIGYHSYPREVYLDATSKTLVTMDYNCYHPTTAANFATIDGGTNDITFATYQASYESHSMSADPYLTSILQVQISILCPGRLASTPVWM